MVIPRNLWALATLLLGIAKVELVSAQSASIPPSLAEDVIAYWTPERRENAVPTDFPDEDDSSPPVVRRRLSVANDDWPGDGCCALPGGQFWQQAVGALFYYDTLRREDRRCSATVINDGGTPDRSLILTAAHCLCEGGKWFKRFKFVPDWDAGQAPLPANPRRRGCEDEKYGCWVGQVALVEDRWVKKSVPRKTPLGVPFDYGVLVVANFNPKSHKKGYLEEVNPILDMEISPAEVETSSSFLPDRPFNFIGYPGTDQPNLRYCEDESKVDERCEEPIRRVPKCRLFGGASGGPGIPANGEPELESTKIHSVASTSSGTGNRGPFLNKFFPCLLEEAKKVPVWQGPPLLLPAGWKEGHVAHDPDGPNQCGLKGKVVNDPHFETWTGRWYDFMGGCDLVFLRAPNFGTNHSLEINIRTKVRYSYSYIQNVAINIKEDILEVDSFGDYFVNGVSGARMPCSIGGYTVSLSKPTEHVSMFEIHLGSGESIVVKTMKDMVSVLLDKAARHRFHGSHGMLGDHETGFLMARDGTIMNQDDPNEFAAEWQVRGDEPMLFQTAEEPQYPQKCVLPDPALKEERRRRLGSSISREAAEIACAQWKDETKENCIFDVMATGDLDMATAGAY